MTAYLKRFILFGMLMTLSMRVFAQYELANPAPPAQMEVIRQGSLIIPLDTVNQRLPGMFNMKAYGLANALLQAEVPVKWAIRSNKTRASATAMIDFSANVTRVFPDTVNFGTISFRSSAFIIDSAWVNKALSVISSYAISNNVAVFRLNVNTNIDIRYTLTHQPRILLLNSNGFDTIAVRMLNEAGFNPGSYTLQLPSNTPFNSLGNWSLISDTHFTNADSGRVNPIIRYITNRGANFTASCSAIGSTENRSFSMTTAGIDSFTTGFSGVQYENHNQPLAQFMGPILTPNGEYKFWNLKAGSTFRPDTYHIMRATTGSPANYAISAIKLRPVTSKGGVLLYLAGHDHYHWTVATGSPNDNMRMNGRRIYINSIFIPASDSIPGIDFTSDVAISMTPQAGFAVKNEPFNITITASNTGPGRARLINLAALLPPGLSFQSASATRGSYNAGTGIWAMDSLIAGQTDTLVLHVIISQLGPISFSAAAETWSYEKVLTNNVATLNLFGVSRPVAVNDTTQFPGPVFSIYNVRANDSDEDGGPFATTDIAAGPFHGTAVLLNGDSIQYTLTNPVFTGIDSIQYVSCDNLPLCDTAWYFIFIPTPLPVNLAGFGGDRNGERIQLRWLTLSEKNNDRFEIERSDDGRRFEWRNEVKGKGNSNAIHHYTTVDEDNDSPILYYRLRQVDYDGSFSFSNIIALPKRNTKSAFHVTIFPNPSDGSFQVIKAEGVSGDMVMSISDISGRVLYLHTWQNDGSGIMVDLLRDRFSLTAGCYLVNFITDTQNSSIKLIIR